MTAICTERLRYGRVSNAPALALKRPNLANRLIVATRAGSIPHNLARWKRALPRFAIDRFLQAKKVDYIREGLTACPAPQREQCNALVRGLEEQSHKISNYLRTLGAGW